MKSVPSISICVPVYNVEKYIARCLLSIMGQSYRGEMECIIVDDCGIDRSIAIAEHLIQGYNGSIDFRIIHHEHNRGLAAARNTAVDTAKGEFIVHVDSDDWIEPTMVEELAKKQIESDADIVSCNALAHYTNGEDMLEEPDYHTKEEMMRNLLQLTLDHVIWRRLIRTSLYKKNNIKAIEGVNIGEDHYTMPRLLYFAKSFAKCDKALYHYNCMNVNSYIQFSRESFDPVKTKSDVASLDILIDFFRKKNEPAFFNQLYETKSRYIYENFFKVLKIGDKASYEEISSHWESIDDKFKEQLGLSRFKYNLLIPEFYYLNRTRVFARILIKKIFGIKLYNL